MLVLGIDPSAKRIAIVGVETFTNTHVVEAFELYIKRQTSQTPESLARAIEAMESVIMAVTPLAPVGQRFAYVEKPLVGRGGISTTIKQSYVGGIIRGCLAANGFQVYDAAPQVWRSKLGIKGKGTVALKAATKRYVAANMPKAAARIGDDPDLTDAAGITIYGLRTQSLAERVAESAASAVSRPA